MRIACAALSLMLAVPAAAQQPQQVAGPEAYRLSTGVTVLALIDEGTLMPTTGLPSGRATLSFQLTPLLGLQLGAIRMAPTDLRLNGGVLGVRLNLTRARLRIAPFVEGGYAVYDAVVDSGGVFVNGAYRPYRRPLHGGAPGGGAGLTTELILGPGVTISLTGGYWAFAGADGHVFKHPMAGAGLRLARQDRAWYWRTSGHDREGPRVVVVAPEPTEEGVVPVGRGQMRVRLSDVSGVDSAEIGGAPLALQETGEFEREAVVDWIELGLEPGPNTITVVATDGAGNRTEHELPVLGPAPDEVGPRIALEAPAEGQWVDTPSVAVRGVLVDESGIAAVTVNGTPAVVESAGSGRDSIPRAPYEMVREFHADVAIGAGEVPLEVVAVDSLGNESWAERVVHRPDRKAPRIVVTVPAPDSTIAARRTRVAGWVFDEGQVANVTVNGVPARFTTVSTPRQGRGRGIGAEERVDPAATELAPPSLGPGEKAVRFEAHVNLVAGPNPLAVVARDAAGNEEEVERIANASTMVAEARTSPAIRIEEPREWAGAGTRGLVASARTSIRVRGMVSDPMGGAIREVRINGDLAAVQSQGGYVRFTGFVPIQEDTREVEVAAWTGDGRFAAKRFSVRPRAAPSAPSAAVSGGFEGQRFAVVIGISDYVDPEIPDLQYADDDARAFYEFLTSPSAGAGGIPAENIELLLNEDATYRNLRSALFTFLEGATENDLVYVYVAAHGAPNPRRPEDLYLLPHDAEADDVPGTAFPMDDVNEAIRRLYAHHTVLITDACHSGGVGMGAATRAVSGAALNAINQAFLMDLGASRAGLAILTASEARELSQEGEEWGGGHGVFTHFLLEGLRGEADRDGDRIVRWGEITEYVRNQVARATRNAQHPSIGSQSHDRYLPMAVVLEGPGS